MSQSPRLALNTPYPVPQPANYQQFTPWINGTPYLFSVSGNVVTLSGSGTLPAGYLWYGYPLSFTDNTSGWYNIANNCDAQLYVGAGSQSVSGVVTSPQAVLPPYTQRDVYVGGQQLYIAAACFGYNFNLVQVGGSNYSFGTPWYGPSLRQPDRHPGYVTVQSIGGSSGAGPTPLVSAWGRLYDFADLTAVTAYWPAGYAPTTNLTITQANSPGDGSLAFIYCDGGSSVLIYGNVLSVATGTLHVILDYLTEGGTPEHTTATLDITTNGAFALPAPNIITPIMALSLSFTGTGSAVLTDLNALVQL